MTIDTEKICTAQLNVSNFYNEQTINSLVNKLNCIGDKVFYNEKSKTIDIESNHISNVEDDDKIKNIIRDWLYTLPADINDINVISDNIDIIFNVVKLGYPNIDKHIINIYLY